MTEPKAQSGGSAATMTDADPSWLPDSRVVMAQLASGILEYFQWANSGEAFRLPYPANLQLAFDQVTLLCWQQNVAPPASVVDLLVMAQEPVGDWPIQLADADADPEESLLSYGRPSVTCEELGSQRGDIEGEMRENMLLHAVLDKARAANAPDSYVAFRRLLIEHPAITALDLDERLGHPDLAMLADQVRQAYAPAPPEALAAGVARTCGGCEGLLLPLDDDRTWVCEDPTCPVPGAAGREHPASEGVWWLHRELRTFITGPGRAELRIAQTIEASGGSVQLWPDFDTWDLSIFDDRPWVVDVKAWRNPIRLARNLRDKHFRVPVDAERAYVVIANEQIQGHQNYLKRLRKSCPQLRPGQQVVAIGETAFVREVVRRLEARG
jgi:hypothetical protein